MDKQRTIIDDIADVYEELLLKKKPITADYLFIQMQLKGYQLSKRTIKSFLESRRTNEKQN